MDVHAGLAPRQVVVGGMSAPLGHQAVSYTHLKLPTSDLVVISVGAGSLKKKKEKKEAPESDTQHTRRPTDHTLHEYTNQNT